ncbi:MAG TPA: hypothetical protein EYQ58_00345 [Candidatus Poseidoniales archaeon]|nr:hypothetical protein [Candidatus Poseidoniales archaeon]
MQYSKRVARDEQRDAAQMLLATGIVLLMSLLSMAIFGVKVAGMNMPHDTSSDAVLVTTYDVIDVMPSLTQHRTEEWISGGLDRVEACQYAVLSVHDDLLHHGEIRGVEVKLIGLTVTDIDGQSLRVAGELGVSDGDAMLTTQVNFTIAA